MVEENSVTNESTPQTKIDDNNTTGEEKLDMELKEFNNVSTDNSEVPKPTAKEGTQASPGKPWRAIIGALTVCLGSFVFGATCAYPSPAMADLQKNPTSFDVDEEQISWVGSIVTLGAMFGGLLGGTYMDRFGRKLALMSCAIPYLIGWVVVVASPSFLCLMAGRAITGVCTGIYSVICPTYIAEISPPSIRGVLGSCHQLVICIGVLYVYSMGAMLSWRSLGIACAFFLVVMEIALYFIPESPRWLLTAGRRPDTVKALQWFRGAGVDIEGDLAELQESLEKSADKASLREFAQPQLLKPLFISLSLMFFQQFSGINVILFNTVQIFEMAESDLGPSLETIIIGIVGVVGTMVSVVVADTAGRRILLLISGVVMTVSMAALGAFFYQLQFNQEYALGSLSWLPITCLVIYVFGFNVAYGPIPWLMMSELFPLRAKGIACSVSTAVNWLSAFILTKFFVNITAVIYPFGGYWLCTGFCALSVPFVIFMVPETKGKTLEEIEKFFK